MTGSVVPPTTISDETVEAAVAAVNDDKLRRMKEQGSFIAVAVSTRDQVGVALLAAVPYIEAGLRERIAAEFESRDVPGLHWVISLEDAARVARGTLSADHTVASDLPGSDSTAPTPEGVA